MSGNYPIPFDNGIVLANATEATPRIMARRSRRFSWNCRVLASS